MANENPLGSFARRVRTKREIAHVQGPDGEDITLIHEEVTDYDPAQGFVTISHVNPIVISDGEKITSHREIAGACYYDSQLISTRSINRCVCGRVMCRSHSVLFRPHRRRYCFDCHRKYAAKGFIMGLVGLLMSPFVEKIDAPEPPPERDRLLR